MQEQHERIHRTALSKVDPKKVIFVNREETKSGLHKKANDPTMEVESRCIVEET